MIKKALLFVTILALVLMIGVVSAFADDDTEASCQMYNVDEAVTAPAYCDGRINAFDIMQPVAIYYTFQDAMATNDDGETYLTQEITGIALWDIDADSNGYLALWVGLDAINTAMASGSGNVLLGSAYGFTLNYVPSLNVFWVTAPNYSYTWGAW